MDSDLLIVGGGLNGTALALAAAKAGVSSTIVDALPRPERAARNFDGRSYALALTSVRMLQGLGLWDRLAGDAQPMLDIKVTDGRAGDGAAFLGLHFDHREIEEGPMGHMVEDRFLRRVLLDAVDASALISHIDGVQVISQTVEPGSVSVTLDNGSNLRGRLLIGADGRQSATARRAGLRRSGWDYGQTGLVCAIAHEKPHNGVAHQFFMPEGPLAILPLTGNRSSIVWTERADHAERINALDDESYLDVLRPRFGTFLGKIELAGERFAYPLGLSLASGFVAERVALVGDAAHGLHPIAGQGLNAGLRDVAALAHVLDKARKRGEEIGSMPVLERYQSWRRFDTATLAAATDVFNRLFSNDNPVLRGVRDLGMRLVQGVPSLRRGFMREAAGLTGDLPDLMRG